MTTTATALDLSTALVGFVPCEGPASRFVSGDTGPARCESPAEWVIWSTCTAGPHRRVPMCEGCVRDVQREIERIPRRSCIAHHSLNPVPAFKFGEL